MNILIDRHHSDLTYALQRLFEDRLGYNLYVTIGHEWWDAGYWEFGKGAWGDDRLARQFLNIAEFREVEPGLFLTFDPCHPERPLYGVTLDRARKMKWDSVLATVQDNQRGFRRFADQMNAKYLYQVGNARQWIDTSLEPLVINMAQEFDYLTTFRYRKPERMNRITSFMNLLPGIPESYGPFLELHALEGYEFRCFGHDCPDGFLKPVASIAEEMSRAGWAYHDKPTGDGFGHVIHNWAAVGRPLIGHARYYQGQRAEAFWRDGETCVDLDKHSTGEAIEIIRSTTPKQHELMCQAIRTMLERVYNPARDARDVSHLLRHEITRATAY